MKGIGFCQKDRQHFSYRPKDSTGPTLASVTGSKRLLGAADIVVDKDDLSSAGLKARLNKLLHEIGHTWLAAVDAKLYDGTLIHLTDIRRDHPEISLKYCSGGHWLPTVEIGATPITMGYTDDSRWEAQPDGSFSYRRSAQPELTFSSIELYLMGLLPPSGVDPFNVFVPDEELPKVPEPGRSYKGKIVRVGIEDVIRGMGERVPAPDSTPRE